MSRTSVTTVISVVLFVAALLPTLYQCIVATLYYAAEPTTASFDTIAPDYTSFNEIVVCTNLWTTKEVSAPLKDEGLRYFMGYTVNKSGLA